jgi:hypothetical protein
MLRCNFIRSTVFHHHSNHYFFGQASLSWEPLGDMPNVSMDSGSGFSVIFIIFVCFCVWLSDWGRLGIRRCINALGNAALNVRHACRSI